MTPPPIPNIDDIREVKKLAKIANIKKKFSLRIKNSLIGKFVF